MGFMANALFTNGSLADSLNGADLNLIDLSSFFEDDHSSMNNSTSACGGGFWQGIEQELLPVQSNSNTCPNGSESLMFSSTDVSFPHWSDLSIPGAANLVPRSNGYSDITLPECGHEYLGLPEPPNTRCEPWDYADALSALMPQDTLFEHNAMSCLNYTSSDMGGLFAGYTRLDGTPAPLVTNHSSDDHDDMGNLDLCIRPEDLALPLSTQHSLSQSNNPKSQESDEDYEPLTAVNIDNLNLLPSRPTPTFNDLIVNFDLNPKPPPSKRKRSSFTRAGKEKVRLVRDWGACTFCRSRKVSVGDNSHPPTCYQNLTSC